MMQNRYIPLALVTGNSMQPRYHDGDLVLVSPAGASQIGDVIIFKEPYHNSLVIHRICGFRENEIFTKGDACKSIDPWVVNREQVIGKAGIRVPKIGRVIKIFQGKGGTLCPN